MTLCVAITVPSKKALNPIRQPIRFPEHGIVLVADTRFTLHHRKGTPTYVDDGIKLWPISDWAVAGFSGDIELGEVALASMRLAMQTLTFREHNMIAKGVQAWLQYYLQRFEQDRTIGTTSILLGTYDQKLDRFFLYILNNKTRFRPREREGIIPIGVGKTTFLPAFKTESLRFTKDWGAMVKAGRIKRVDNTNWYQPWQPGDYDNIGLIKVASLLSIAVDTAAKAADIDSVGGLQQIYMLTRSGLHNIRYSRRTTEGGWAEETPRDLRTYAEMAHREYEIPRMREDGSIDTDNSMIVSWEHV